MGVNCQLPLGCKPASFKTGQLIARYTKTERTVVFGGTKIGEMYGYCDLSKQAVVPTVKNH
jgi:hypothetical protein